MAGDDKERDRGHAHRSNGSKPVQAASAELTRQGTEACASIRGSSARFGTVIVSAMRQLSAVPWLRSGGRIALSILCVATPGVWRIWPSENQHWRETGAEQRIDHGIYPTVSCCP